MHEAIQLARTQQLTASMAGCICSDATGVTRKHAHTHTHARTRTGLIQRQFGSQAAGFHSNAARTGSLLVQVPILVMQVVLKVRWAQIWEVSVAHMMEHAGFVASALVVGVATKLIQHLVYDPSQVHK